MRKLGLASAVAFVLTGSAGESKAQLIMQPAVPTGPFTVSTPFATGMVDNSIPPVIVQNRGVRRGMMFRRGIARRRARVYATPPQAATTTRQKKAAAK